MSVNTLLVSADLRLGGLLPPPRGGLRSLDLRRAGDLSSSRGQHGHGVHTGAGVDNRAVNEHSRNIIMPGVGFKVHFH